MMNELIAAPQQSLTIYLCNELDHNPRLHGLTLQQALKQINVFKLPETCYQQMFSIVQTVGTNEDWLLEMAQEKVRKVMMDWLEEAHPDKELSTFCDVNEREARAIHPQLTWGMYILLLPKDGFSESRNGQVGTMSDTTKRLLSNHNTLNYDKERYT